VPDVAEMAEIMARTTGDQQTRESPSTSNGSVDARSDRQVRIIDGNDAPRPARAPRPPGHRRCPAEVSVRARASPRAAQAIILAAKVSLSSMAATT
jgi:hypothetical protein